jgi:hypothetical protein
MNSHSSFTREDLLQIARSQRAIISLILVNLLLAVGLFWSVIALGPGSRSAGAMESVGLWVPLLLNLIAVVFIYRLAKALRQTAWVYALAAFFPCVGLITLLLINHFATRALHRHGVRVGLMGALKSDLEHLPPTVVPPTSTSS